MGRNILLIILAGFFSLVGILNITSAQNSADSNTLSNRYYSNSNTNNLASNRAANVEIEGNSNLNNNSAHEMEFLPIILKQISIQKKVKFPKNGTVRAQVIEELGKPFTIRFINDFDDTIASFVMRNNGGGYVREDWHSAVDPKISLREIEIQGVPSPLIQMVIVQPGGSDYGFWSALFGEVNGKINLLTPITTQFSWEGGVQIGNLGKGNGVGLAVWNSIWGDGEAHYDAHFYQVDFYQFNKKLGKFVKTKIVKTKLKHETPALALESLGLGFYHDAVRDFPEFLEYRENF